MSHFSMSKVPRNQKASNPSRALNILASKHQVFISVKIDTRTISKLRRYAGYKKPRAEQESSQEQILCKP